MSATIAHVFDTAAPQRAAAAAVAEAKRLPQHLVVSSLAETYKTSGSYGRHTSDDCTGVEHPDRLPVDGHFGLAVSRDLDLDALIRAQDE